MIEPPEVVLTDSRRVRCDGATAIKGGAALGHPRVWLEIDERGYAECGYCDRRFVLRGGPAERGLNEIGSGDINPEQGAAHI
jgi:NADH dehydrogenase (ubiquinone) Fe-S protein 6